MDLENRLITLPYDPRQLICENLGLFNREIFKTIVSLKYRVALDGGKEEQPSSKKEDETSEVLKEIK